MSSFWKLFIYMHEYLVGTLFTQIIASIQNAMATILVKLQQTEMDFAWQSCQGCGYPYRTFFYTTFSFHSTIYNHHIMPTSSAMTFLWFTILINIMIS